MKCAFVTEMEVVPYGKNFRLVPEDELPELLDYLSQHLPQSLKVSFSVYFFLNQAIKMKRIKRKFNVGKVYPGFFVTKT